MMTREQKIKEWFEKNPKLVYYEYDHNDELVIYKQWVDGDWVERIYDQNKNVIFEHINWKYAFFGVFYFTNIICK